MNLVAYWMKNAKDKHGSIAAGVRHLNMVCDMKLQTSTIYRMRDGHLGVNACLQSHMVNDVLLTALDEAGIDSMGITTPDFVELIRKLSLPMRVKK